MWRWLVGITAAGGFGAVIMVGAVAVLLGGTGVTAAAAPGGPCEPVIAAADPWDTATLPDGTGGLDAEQIGVVELIISIGKQRNLPPRAWQIAIQAGMTESRLRNLPYGDRDSLGIFQLRPSQGWGTVAQVTDPVYAVNKFYDVMLTVPDWQTRRPGDVAQAVERSAFPSRYHQWEALAVELIAAHSGGPAAAQVVSWVCPQPPPPPVAPQLPAPPPSDVAAKAISFALGEVGKPYVWGAEGPDSYDCSGLMMRAYEAAGITLPRTSRQQYWAGTQLPVRQAQPGDLLFWAYDTADPATIHHVAMYLGNGQMVEAANSSVPLRQRAVSFDEDELMPLAVRPGVGSSAA